MLCKTFELNIDLSGGCAMKRLAGLFSAAALVVTVGCAQTDTGITTNVKAKFATDDVVKANDINVDTKDHIVTLSGAVGSEAVRHRAVEIASTTGGVRDVVDRLTVRGAEATTGTISDHDLNLRDDARRGGQVLKHDARETGHAVNEGARETGHAVNEGARDSGDVVKEGAEKTGHVIKEGAEGTGHAIKEGAEDVGHGAKKGAIAVKHGAEKVGDKIGDVFDKDHDK
jgi:hypothetical protein